MAPMIISCCHQLKPPAPTAARLQPAGPQAPAHLPLLRRACVAAVACCVVAVGSVDGAAMATVAPHEPAAATLVHAQAPRGVARWSDRRQCPPWRANSLENIVPENLPRPSARRRYHGITAADKAAPAPAASPDAVLPFLAQRSGSGMGCFSL